jgi:hypothetical protein
MSVFIGIFWSLFVLDMIGDNNPTGGVVAAVMMIITCPVIFISLQWILTHILINEYKYRKSRINDTIDKVSQSINRVIWQCILSILMMNEIINTDTNKNTNTNTNTNTNDDRESNVTEVISPLGVHPNSIQ